MSKPIKVYIAAPYPERAQAIQLMTALESRQFEITSTWLKAPDEMADEFARLDLEDVARADVLVALNPTEWANNGTGGRHVEFGYALALAKPIVLIGVRSHIFHHLNEVCLIGADVSMDDLSAHLCWSGQRCAPEAITRATALRSVIAEVSKAEAKHKPMNSPHEAYAVIQEEVDELWDDVKADRGRTPEGLKEAVQIAAMGIRYVRDLAPV